MKKLFFLLAVVGTINATAQTNTVPDGFTAGYIINNSNEKLEGAIKESFRKGIISFADVAGAKKSYTPADITEFAIGTDVYVAYLNDFYKVGSTGKKSSLLQKVTNNSGKIAYNGAEAYTLTTTEGNPGDYYLKLKATNMVALVTKKNFESVFASFCADCTVLQTSIQGKQLDYNTITKAVEQYNDCN
ncbi:MAG: hypothetical protein ABIN67_11965 [Ferruginibacter sp.]